MENDRETCIQVVETWRESEHDMLEFSILLEVKGLYDEIYEAMFFY